MKKETKFNAKDFWQKLWFLIKPFQKRLRTLLLLVILLEFLGLAGPYLFKMIIDNIVDFESEKIFLLAGLAGAMFLTNQVISFFNYTTNKRIFSLLMETDVLLLGNAHGKMMELDLEYHARENTGNKIIKIQSGVDKIRNLLANMFWGVLPAMIQLTLTIGLLFWIDWRFGLVSMVFAPLFVFLTFKADSELRPSRKKRFDNHERASGTMAQSIININTVKSFVQEKRELEELGKITQRIKLLFGFEYKKLLNYNLLRFLVLDLNRLLVVFFGIFLILKDSISIGSLVFAFTISERAFSSLFQISRLYDQIMESAESVKRLHDLDRQKPSVKNPSNGLRPKQIKGLIAFKKVHYRYKESNIQALRGVNLEIEPNKFTALVGPSGGGKTTLARMIYRHYDPQKGTVLLDNKDLKKYDLFSFRRHIAIVPQEVEVFNASVRENIAYAKPDANMKEIRSAAKVANASQFIELLKDGYETLIGERGMKLSGGQRQRLGIARAILANPKILIFDEATSNLDSQSERLIQRAIDKIRQGRTMIVIAHRLSTIKKADKIIVLEDGNVVETGSHQELSKAGCGLYKKLLALQEVGDVE